MATPVNPLLQQLLALHRGKPEAVPKGHKTRKELAKEWGVCDSVAGVLIATGIKNKLMGKTFYRVQVGKILRKTEHYYQL